MRARLDEIIRLLSILVDEQRAQRSHPAKPEERGVPFDVEQSRRDFDAMMSRRRADLGRGGNDPLHGDDPRLMDEEWQTPAERRTRR